MRISVYRMGVGGRRGREGRTPSVRTLSNGKRCLWSSNGVSCWQVSDDRVMQGEANKRWVASIILIHTCIIPARYGLQVVILVHTYSMLLHGKW